MIHFQLSAWRKLPHQLDQLHWPKTMFVGYNQSVLTVRRPVYRKIEGTYRIANCSVQVMDVVNIGGIVEISKQPIERTANRKQCSLMNRSIGGMYCLWLTDSLGRVPQHS